ncbi:alpha beta hydrolase protein [Naviculisporaceae sp. PSN 640]
MPYFTLSSKTSSPIQIFYLDQGPASAPPVLLIHGVTCDLHDWSWQVPLLLSLGYRVISSDLRGHGKSSSPRPTLPNPTSWPGPDALDKGVIDYYPQTLAVDQVKLLDHLGISSAIVIGHSLGSTISYFLATTYPERVKALVTIDPYHNQTSEMREPYIGLFATNGPEILVNWFKQFGYMSMTESGNPAPEWYTAWHARRTLSTDDSVMAGLAWGGWEAPDSLGKREVAGSLYLSDEGCGIRSPMLVAAAVEDNLVLDRQMVRKKAESLDEVVLVEGKGHWLHQLFGAEEFNGILKGWLEKCGLLPVPN